MLKRAEKVDLAQISLTGLRAIAIMGLLIKNPMKLEEIRVSLIDMGILEPKSSNDILRIDINTLRHAGCEISKANSKTGYRFVMESNPFSLKLDKSEIALMKRIHKKMQDNMGLEALIKYNEFFKKIASFIDDEDQKEELYGISALKSYNMDMLVDLLYDCKCSNKLKLRYYNPVNEKTSNKNIISQKLVFNNEKVYLQGYDINKKEQIVLNVKRIREVLSRETGNGGVEQKSVDIKFTLHNFNSSGLQEGETIIEKLDNGYVVLGKYYNEFYAMQRILSFGSDCLVLEPVEFKNKVIQKLKDIRRIYES